MSLATNRIYHGDARVLMGQLQPDSIACSIWSPPYHVGKSYERKNTYEDWVSLLDDVIGLHYPAIKPGGFLAINIADILCFQDRSMPKIQAATPSRHTHQITKQDVLRIKHKHPTYNRDQLAKLLGCSEQTIDRRLNGNNIRGGKYNAQTRVKLVGGLIEELASKAGFFLYDRRVWAKDPAWANSRWHSLSYRSVDEFEYIFIFWKPGITVVDRKRLAPEEWSSWGSRAVWQFRSVRANDDHEAKFPLELPLRLIKLLTAPEDTVLDCFMGSGTTAVAAIRLGRNYIGFDLVEKYVELARRACALEKARNGSQNGHPLSLETSDNRLREQQLSLFAASR